MNKHLLKQFIIIIGALFLVSCKFEYKKPVYHDPYDARHNQLLGDVHNVREVEYAAKMEAKQLVEGEVMSSKNYLFNLDGKILSRMDTTFIPQNETSFQEYSYSRIGKLRKRTTKTRSSDRTLVYKPEFDYKGDAFFVLYRENSTYRDTVGDSKSTSKATFTFSNEGLLKEREVSTNGKKVIETKYEYDNKPKSAPVGEIDLLPDILLKKSETTNYNTNRKTTGKYNKLGNLESETVVDAKTGKIFSYYTYVYDNFDKSGNWLKRTKKDGNGKIVSITFREISYHHDEADAPLFYNLKEANSISGYFQNVYTRLTADVSDTPSKALIIIVLCSTLLLTLFLINLWCYYSFKRRKGWAPGFFEWKKIFPEGFLFKDFGGKLQKNNMKRIWVYNKEPYLKVASILLTLVGGFIAALIVLLLIGAIVWLLFGITMILFTIVNFGLVKWLLVIAAVIGLWYLGWGTLGAVIAAIFRLRNIIVIVASILAYIFIPFVPSWIFYLVALFVIFFSGSELILMILGTIGCGALLSFGVAAISNKMWLEALGHSTIATGFEFLHSVNLSNWFLNLFGNYWDVLLWCFLLPVILFLAIAFIIITFNSLLIGFEWIVMSVYNVSRPCPVCGSKKEMLYLPPKSKKPHPVKLRPGVYGSFHHKCYNPAYKLPTLLLNGKWKLDRLCQDPNCPTKKANEVISSETKNMVGMGTEVHIGVVFFTVGIGICRKHYL